MASITKRGDGWRVRWRDPDGRSRSRQLPTKRAALDLKREVEERVALGRRWEPRDARQEPDLEEVLASYIRDKARTLGPNTIERYARNLDIFLRWLREREGRRARLSPDLLTKRLLIEFYNDLAQNGRHGRPRTDSTRRKIVSVLQLAWAWAFNDDELGEFMPRPRSIETRPPSGAPTVAPNWGEMDAVIHAFSADSWHRKLATLLRFTGLRVQQAMGLKWEDVDLERATLQVRGDLGKSRQEMVGRIVPISPHLVNELASWGRRDGFLIVTNRVGVRERLARARDMARAWERAGVRPAVWRGRPHHAFRKGFVTGLRRGGADPDAVEFLVGHSLGLRGVYTDPEALGLLDAVAIIPPVGAATNVETLDRRRGGAES